MACPRPSANEWPAVKPAEYSVPSPCSVCAPLPSNCRPSKSSRSLKLTTPATASEPYTADAPPVTISTRWISEGGMTFTSTTPLPFAGTRRRPSSRTSVEVVPSPRNWTLPCPPLPGLFDVLVKSGTNCGIRLRTESTLVEPVSSNFSAVMLKTGLADSKSGRAMREPVTTISSRASFCASAGNVAMDSKPAKMPNGQRMAVPPHSPPKHTLYR